MSDNTREDAERRSLLIRGGPPSAIGADQPAQQKSSKHSPRQQQQIQTEQQQQQLQHQAMTSPKRNQRISVDWCNCIACCFLCLWIPFLIALAIVYVKFHGFQCTGSNIYCTNQMCGISTYQSNITEDCHYSSSVNTFCSRISTVCTSPLLSLGACKSVCASTNPKASGMILYSIDMSTSEHLPCFCKDATKTHELNYIKALAIRITIYSLFGLFGFLILMSCLVIALRICCSQRTTMRRSDDDVQPILQNNDHQRTPKKKRPKKT